MPTYEYACTRCGTQVEVVQRFDDEPLTTCTRCDGPLRKVFHPAGIVFRGSGFYATDSRRSASSEAGSKEGAAGTADAAKSAKKDRGSKKDAGTKEKSA